MSFFIALRGFLIPVAHAVVLENAGTWSNTGAPNVGVMMMWAKICTILPFCSLGPAAPAFFIAKVLNFIFLAIGGVAVCMIIYAGIKLVVSQGSDEALTDARKIVLYAVGGIALALLGATVMAYISSTALPQILM